MFFFTVILQKLIAVLGEKGWSYDRFLFILFAHSDVYDGEGRVNSNAAVTRLNLKSWRKLFAFRYCTVICRTFYSLLFFPNAWIKLKLFMLKTCRCVFSTDVHIKHNWALECRINLLMHLSVARVFLSSLTSLLFTFAPICRSLPLLSVHTHPFALVDNSLPKFLWSLVESPEVSLPPGG